MIDWKNKPLVRDMGDFTRGLGIACSMQDQVSQMSI